MAQIPSYISLLKCYNDKPAEVKSYFEHLPKLISDGLPYEVAIAYSFLKVEQAQNRTLYGGVVKLHRGDAQFVGHLLNFQYLTRVGFKDIYKNVFGHPLNEITSIKLKEAEKTRDKVIHGKSVNDNELRVAIADVLEYAELLNQEVNLIAGFKPFSDMRGFKGRAESLDKRTTKWVMKGMGFDVKA